MIKGVSFVGIAVKDIEGATRLYAEMFGLEPWDQGVMDMPGAKAIMLPLGGCSIELLQPTASQDDHGGRRFGAVAGQARRRVLPPRSLG